MARKRIHVRSQRTPLDLRDVLVKIRAERGLTQVEAAGIMGWSSGGAWGEMERCTQEPKISRLNSIANKFQLSTKDRIRLVKAAGYQLEGKEMGT